MKQKKKVIFFLVFFNIKKNCLEQTFDERFKVLWFGLMDTLVLLLANWNVWCSKTVADFLFWCLKTKILKFTEKQNKKVLFLCFFLEWQKSPLFLPSACFFNLYKFKSWKSKKVITGKGFTEKVFTYFFFFFEVEALKWI